MRFPKRTRHSHQKLIRTDKTEYQPSDLISTLSSRTWALVADFEQYRVPIPEVAELKQLR